MNHEKRNLGFLERAIRAIFPPTETTDLCDFPPLLKDAEVLATFFQECSAEFPGSQRICLPLAMADIVLVSPPPTISALRLLKRLERGDHVVLSNRLLPDDVRQRLTLESILFV